MSFLLALVHTIDWNGTSARLIQVLQATRPEHLRWVRLASVLLLRTDLISGREGALRCGELCSGSTKGRQLRSTSTKVWKGLLDLANAITQLHLLVILQIEFLLGYA